MYFFGGLNFLGVLFCVFFIPNQLNKLEEEVFEQTDAE